MPSVDRIIDYWRTQDAPWLSSWYIGWGEPFCFACGWLPPVRPGRKDSWRHAASWLERAHLQDHVVAGDDSPENLVMLCQFCHDEMPEFDDRDAALEWVQKHPRKDGVWQLFTDARDWGRRTPGGSRTMMFRARVQFLELRAPLEEELRGRGARGS